MADHGEHVSLKGKKKRTRKGESENTDSLKKQLGMPPEPEMSMDAMPPHMRRMMQMMAMMMKMMAESE